MTVLKDDLQDNVEIVLGLPSTAKILTAVCEATGLRFAAVARVTDDRWITCAARDSLNFGLEPGDELEVESTLCHEVQTCGSTIVIDDAMTDPIYRNHHTPRQYGFRSYISVPIVDREGVFFGTLCGLDPEPKQLNQPSVLDTFELFADLLAAQLDARRDLQRQERELTSERSFGRLREEFIAMLGHDLRNPVAAILAGARILARKPLDPDAREIITQIASSASRMDDMIGDLLDLARGRLGGSIPIDRTMISDLDVVFDTVVTEVEATTGREVQRDFHLAPFFCDPGRIGQVLSNLVSNAVTHGLPDEPIRVHASVADEGLELSVSNAGDPISPIRARSMFRPFYRGQSGSKKQGLGLGLYIASEIAKSHGGKLTAASRDGQVIFTMTVPWKAPAASGPTAEQR